MGFNELQLIQQKQDLENFRGIRRKQYEAHELWRREQQELASRVNLKRYFAREVAWHRQRSISGQHTRNLFIYNEELAKA